MSTRGGSRERGFVNFSQIPFLLEHFICSVYEKCLILIIWMSWCHQLTYQIFLPQNADYVFLYILYLWSFPWEWLFEFTCIFFKGFCTYVNFQGHELKLSVFLHYRIFLQKKNTEFKNTCACTLTHLKKTVYSHSFDVKTGIPPIYRVK